MGLTDRLQHAWNAFLGRDPTNWRDSSYSYSYKPDRQPLHYGNEKSLLTPIIVRIAVEVASLRFEHARLDAEGRYIGPINSNLNDCLNLAANRDQTGRAFIQDAVMSLLDEGHIAIVPLEGDTNPNEGSFDPDCIRVGKIVEWRPNEVKVEVYNQDTCKREEVVFSKECVAIVENPYYAVMNQTNSTARRLIRKLGLLDAIDNMSASGKLDLIIQLPYPIKNETQARMARSRQEDIERQLATSNYGIAYIDATEKVTQLNRALENKLFQQIEYYNKMLLGELGMSEEVMNGNANEEQMLSFYNRAVETIATAIVDAMRWKFLTKTARTQGQTVMFFRDVFKLVPVSQIADIADKFTRNEILSSNEVRGIVGFKPSNQEGADDLRNKNLNQDKQSLAGPSKAEEAGETIVKEG